LLKMGEFYAVELGLRNDPNICIVGRRKEYFIEAQAPGVNSVSCVSLYVAPRMWNCTSAEDMNAMLMNLATGLEPQIVRFEDESNEIRCGRLRFPESIGKFRRTTTITTEIFPEYQQEIDIKPITDRVESESIVRWVEVVPFPSIRYAIDALFCSHFFYRIDKKGLNKYLNGCSGIKYLLDHAGKIVILPGNIRLSGKKGDTVEQAETVEGLFEALAGSCLGKKSRPVGWEEDISNITAWEMQAVFNWAEKKGYEVRFELEVVANGYQCTLAYRNKTWDDLKPAGEKADWVRLLAFHECLETAIVLCLNSFIFDKYNGLLETISDKRGYYIDKPQVLNPFG